MRFSDSIGYPIDHDRHSDGLIPSIAFVGSGPTTIYTLLALVGQASCPFQATIFEEQPVMGRGTPYRPGWNDPAMLANIASIEIPPIEETLVAWLTRQDDARLADLGIARDEIGDRTFYPRITLGEFFHDQLDALIARARVLGNRVDVRTSCRVLDAKSGKTGMSLSVQPGRGAPFEETFDHVVLATGHQWPTEPEVRPGYFLVPWPASALAAVPPVNIGMRGSSLTAIDAAVALANVHGEFVDDGATLEYVAKSGTEDFRMTMLSRKGLLPEADFYFPMPYEPLTVCTAERIEEIARDGKGQLLDRAFELFRAELAQADPAYALKMGLNGLNLDSFCDAYFAQRRKVDPFAWAEQNLREAQANYEACRTIAWRYAILRMHETVQLIVPYLSRSEFDRFSRTFATMFVDDYATVPHLSIRRLLALHAADKLSVVAVGESYDLDCKSPDTGAVLRMHGEVHHFPVFIEATGQRALGARDFPFPSLRAQGIIRDADPQDDKGRSRGILIDDEFHPVCDAIPEDQLFCLSLPYLMGRHPFAQGITSSHEMGEVVGAQLAAAFERYGHPCCTSERLSHAG